MEDRYWQILKDGRKEEVEALIPLLKRLCRESFIEPILKVKTEIRGSDYLGPMERSGLRLADREALIHELLICLAKAHMKRFMEVIRDVTHPLRWAAIDTITGLDDSRLFPFLKEQIEHNPGKHKAQLIQALGMLNHPDKYIFLYPYLKDSDNAVATQVYLIFHREQDTTMLPYLRSVLREIRGEARMVENLLKHLIHDLESLVQEGKGGYLKVVRGKGA